MINKIKVLLTQWYELNKRTLPWRDSGDAYRIWLSEIILQQTRVEQGTPYYLAFTNRFKTITELADASEDEILKLWQGLGYYSRARNLHAAAKQIKNEHGGKFPTSYDSIIQLKGVGPYTAAAISSIAFNEAKAVVDGNVIRVISRLFGIEEAVNNAQVQKQIQALADELLDQDKPGMFNQAMMEFGALYCTPKSSNCAECVLSTFCIAKQNNLVDAIPFKEKKLKRRSRFFHFIVFENEGKTFLQQRGEKDVWQGLFQFPLIETESDFELDSDMINENLKSEIQINKVAQVKKHVLSHQDLWGRFYHVSGEIQNVSNYKLVSINELHTFALPRLIDRYLETEPFNA
jgi:A/G-specific adenine glycosylase